MTQTNGSFCVRPICESDSEASIHQSMNDRFMTLLLRPFPSLHRYYLLNLAATLELFNLAGMKAWGKHWRRDLHPHAGTRRSYHGLTPCFSSKECLIRTAWAGLEERASEWGYGGVESVFPWRHWRRKHGALSVQWHLIDRYVREVCWCPEPVGRTTELVRVNLSSQAPTRSHQSARRHGSCPPPRDKAAGRHGVWPRPPVHLGRALWNSSNGFKPHPLSILLDRPQ